MKSFRLMHAVFAAAVIAAYFTAEELGLVHAWLGYGIAVILAVRLVLGLARRAGFSFHRLVPSLTAAPAARRGLRHPAIAPLLTLLLAINVTGSAVTGIIMDQGGTLVGKSIRSEELEGREGRGGDEDHDDADESARTLSRLSLIGTARADEDEREEGGEGEEEGLLAELHEVLGSLLLPLALVHMAYMLVLRFGQARFMLFMPKRKP